MRSSKSKEVPLPNPRSSQNKETVQDVVSSWDALSQTKAALRHIENKLEVTPTSTAVIDSVMDAKKSASATRKISRKDGRYLDDSWVSAPASKSSKPRKEKSRSPLRATTLESNVKKNSRVEFREPLVSYRETYGTPFSLSPSHLESKHVYCVHEEKAENGKQIIDHWEDRNIHCCDFESSQPSVIGDTVVRFLNDGPGIDAFHSSECLIKMGVHVRTEEELPNRAKGSENTSKLSLNMGHNVDPKVLLLSDSSPSSTSACNSQRLDISKRRQHDVKLEKLKERIRKQWEHSEEINGQVQTLGHIDHPVMVVNVDNSVTTKVRKVATAPPAPAYKGFNPSETKIRTPDGKVWQEAEFQSMSRELYRDLALQLAGGHIGRAESDPKLDISHKHLPRSSERSRSRVRSENNTVKSAPSLPDNKQEEKAALNKDFLPVEIRGILDDLQLDHAAQTARQEIGELQNQKSSAPVQVPRSHSPVKRKPDKIMANEDPPVISKKRHYDTDEVRQYIVRQQEERRRKQNEEKKAQKEATEQKNKRLQELYRRQREAFTKAKAVPPDLSASRRLQETYSKLLLEKTLLEEPAHQHVTQETQHVGILRKDYDSVLPAKKSHNKTSGPLTFTPQPYLTSQAPHPDALLKPSTSQYKSKLDRIEALKATAASLSSRIESEAKKLAGASINYGSVWTTEYVKQAPQENGLWTKAVSPPVKEDIEDVFSARIQKMLGTCVSHATFDDDLPGVGNLSEFKKLPEMIRPQSAISSFRMTSPSPKPGGLLAQLCKRQADSCSDIQVCSQERAKRSLCSSIDSVSEGPLLSEGSLSEEEGGRDARTLLKVAEILKEKDYCAGERTAYEPIKEFQKEAEKFLPLLGHIGGTQSKGPWEELAKGSPHSVINIFTKSYQLYGKGFEDRGTLASRPFNATTTPLSIISYEDDFVSSPGSGTLTEKKPTLESQIGGSNLGIQEDHSSRKSAFDLSSVDGASQHSSGAQSALSSRSCASKGKKGRQDKIDWSKRFSPAGLQHRMAAELSYLSAIEESVRQLSDMERVRGISLAQQESVSLAQIIKAHSESLQQVVKSQREVTEVLQEATCKIAAQQTEAARLTTDAARQICEMAELTRTHISDAIGASGVPLTALYDHQRQHLPDFMKQLRTKTETDRSSGSSRQESPSVPSCKENEKKFHGDKMESSIDEQLQTAADDSLRSDSIPSLPDEKDSTSIATEYSLKFDESMTEDEIEEKSFRSLLPSESHRRFNMEKKRGHHDDSDEDASPDKTALSSAKAEIKRLQEANKAARKERQLILKQQEEIERIRQTTIKLQEKLKSAGENKLGSHSDDDTKDNKAASPGPAGLETRSPSPISISSSETSSIMQKLKNMRSRMDEKFLTKREQKLMQRRQHAEELLEWKRRLDAEEAEIQQMEKQALAAWDKELVKPTTPKKELENQRTEQKGIASEEESPIPSYSHRNSENCIPEELGSPSVLCLPSESMIQVQPGSPDHSILTEEMVFSQELESTSPSKHSPPKSCSSVSKQESSKGSHRTEGHCHLPVKSHQPSYSWSDDSLSVTQSETTSDQSDIESRIRALKDELRKRRSVVEQLKKEQRKRQKERLKAQEASLIRQLETYDEFIKKTEGELSQDLDTSPTSKLQIKTLSSVSEKPKIKPHPLHRSETAKNWKSVTESERSRGSLASIAEHIDSLSCSERAISERSLFTSAKGVAVEEHLQASSPVVSSRKTGSEQGDSLESAPSLPPLMESRAPSRIYDVFEAKAEDSSQKSEIQELEYTKLEKSETEDACSKQSGRSEVLLRLDLNSEILSNKELPSDSTNIQNDLGKSAMEIFHEVLKENQCDQSTDHSPDIQSARETHEHKGREKGDTALSEHLSAPKESSYSEDFEVSSFKKGISAEVSSFKKGISAEEINKDDSEVSSSALRKDSQSYRDKSQPMRSSRSRASGFGSDDEISECLSEKSLSIHSSVHSERLLELKSPTELMKSKERSDVGHEQGITDSLSLAAVSAADELLDFHIGDRVLIGNVQPGTLRFKGETNFAKGFWAGVELDKPEGNNNGTYDGIEYFVCKDKHGIFAPPQKISHILENFNDYIDINEDEESYSDEHYQFYNQEQKDIKCLKDREDDIAEYFCEKSLASMHSIEASVDTDRSLNIETDNKLDNSGGLEAHVHQQSSVDPLISCKENKALVSDITDYVPDAAGATPDDTSSEESKLQHLAEKEENSYSQVSEKPSTPLLDLLTKEKNQLEAQLKSSISEEKKSNQQLETVSLLTDSLLKDFVKDTVSQLQQIKKSRNEKIQLSNQEILDQKEVLLQDPPQNIEEQLPSVPSCFLRSELEDEKEELSSPDMCPRPESPVFGASGQEELAKRLAELEISREFLSTLDDQDWFDEDFGLSSSHKIQKNKAEETIVPLMAEPKRAPQKPCETLLAVPHTAEEVESLVHNAAEELWKWKELGQDLHSLSIPKKLLGCASKGLDIESTSKRVYKQAVFDLTKEIFEEIFAEDPNLNQPVWMKPCRINSSYFRRVKNPNNLNEIKVQELHEEEAQWVNYDEDELCVKMQLADGIFETLIKDTIDVLNQISEKQGRMLLV
ncbi:centrosomal protein 350 [Cricetulus griseus]